MSWRKRLVRGLVFSVLLLLAAGGWLYQRLTSPAAVRQQVVAKLAAHFRDTDVRLESASLRLLGGISIRELRLIRRDDPEQRDLLYVPSGILYHDKEQLLDGKLVIRKIELHRPRFHIVRHRDGRWNTTGLFGPADPEQVLPMLVLRQGSIVLEDRFAMPDAAPVEIKNLNLSLVNDPPPTVTVQLRGAADLIGELTASLEMRRDSNSMNLVVDVPALPIGPALVQRLAAYCPHVAEHARRLEAVARIHAELTHEPDGEPAWTHNVRCRLSQGKFQHPCLPLALDHIEAELHCVDGRFSLDKLTARAGQTQMEAEGSASALHPDADFEGKLKIQRLAVNSAMFTHLPENLRRLNEEYRPVGTVNLDMEFARRGGLWRRHTVVVSTGLAVNFVKFPYPLEKVQGRLEEQCDQEKHVLVRRLDVVGAGSAGRPAHIQGTITGEDQFPEVSIDLWGEHFPLDEPLLAALPDRFQKLARAFHPTGKTDYHIRIRRPMGTPPYAVHVTARIHDAAVRYDVFPYPLENVSGVLEVTPEGFAFRDFHGTHKGGAFRTWGGTQPDSRDRVVIHIRGQDLLLDEELEAALAPKLRVAWKTIAPAGRMNVEAQVVQQLDRPEDLQVAVTAKGCTVRPTFFPYELSDVAGTVRYGHGKVDLEQLAGKHGSTVFSLEKGDIFLKPAGGFWARLTGMKGRPIVVDADFLTALPRPLAKVCGMLAPGTSVGLAAELVIDMPSEPNIPPDIYWDGGIAIQDATLEAGVKLEQVRGQLWCQGRHDGRQLKGLKGNLLFDQAVLFRQPFREIHSHLHVAPEAPDVLRMPDLKARIFGGDVGGEVRVEFGPTVHYDLNLTALQVRLEELGRHNQGAKAQWKGLASGRLYLSGHGTDIHGLEGHGSFDVPSGQMYNLPLLLDLIKVLGLRPPDRTAFEEAHAAFSIRGPRVIVSRLDLDGNAISLSGQGELNLDGTDLQLDFYAVWGRIKQMLPPIFREIPPAVGQQLLKIKMRGSVSDPKITKEPVPALVEPMEKLIKRFAARAAQAKKMWEADRPTDGGRLLGKEP